MAKKLVEEFGPGKTKKPFVVVEWGGKYPDDRTIRTILKESGMAVYPGAEEALRVLSKLAGYQEYLNDPEEHHHGGGREERIVCRRIPRSIWRPCVRSSTRWRRRVARR